VAESVDAPDLKSVGS